MMLENLETNSSNSSLSGKTKAIRKKREKYMKISAHQRDQLLERVFFQNKKVKKAASELNINYSSAKTILFLHRKKVKAFLVRKGISPMESGKEEERRCHFKCIPQPFIHNKVQLVTMQGGKKMHEKTAVFHGAAGKGEARPSAFNLVKKPEESNLQLMGGKSLEGEKIENLKKLFMFFISNYVKKE